MPRHHVDNFDRESHHNQMPRSSHTQQAGATATRGRPRDAALSDAIISAAEQRLRQVGYARMSLRSVAEAAGTTVPSLLRRYPGKATLATAVVGSLRVDPLTAADAPPRDRALALLENFDSNPRRPNSIALLSTLLAEEPPRSSPASGHDWPRLVRTVTVAAACPAAAAVTALPRRTGSRPPQGRRASHAVRGSRSRRASPTGCG